VQAEPAALAELDALGVPRVPALAVNGRAVHGWNPAAYAELAGVPYRDAGKLQPAELAARLDRILGAAESLVRALPVQHLDAVPPERERSVRDLAFHVFRVALSFVDAMDWGHLRAEWFDERAPGDLHDGPAVARYGALVRGRLAGWFEGAGASEYARVIDVYYGPQSGHDLLERTTWHAAQHVRQLYALAERFGVAPPEPLPGSAFERLPLPDGLW
jgi:hypothetical protein